MKSVIYIVFISFHGGETNEPCLSVIFSYSNNFYLFLILRYLLKILITEAVQFV